MKFRRKRATESGAAETTTDTDLEVGAETDAETGDGPAEAEAPTGPYDAEDLADEAEEGDRVDLGSLLISPEPGRELRLQVEESSGAVQAVVLAGEDGAIELRAFAAPRHGDLWSEVRAQIAADMAQRGGTATERDGRFGTELLCQVEVTRPEGGKATQPSRIVGVNGSRWLLRATFLGRPAVEADEAAEWEDTLARVAVRRGDHAMPVGEPLPLVLPEQARRVTPS